MIRIELFFTFKMPHGNKARVRVEIKKSLFFISRLWFNKFLEIIERNTKLSISIFETKAMFQRIEGIT